jgi:hypothetical protein
VPFPRALTVRAVDFVRSSPTAPQHVKPSSALFRHLLEGAAETGHLGGCADRNPHVRR